MLIQYLFSDPMFYVFAVSTVIASIVAHELAHGWAAISYGDDTPLRTGHMTLNPLTHMGQASMIMLCVTGIAWGAMPINPRKFCSPKWGQVVVSLAGPMANLAIALVVVSVIKLFHIEISDDMDAISNYLFYAALWNMMLFLFNLLPVPPLDGFHAISEFFPNLKGYQNGSTGMLLLIALFAAGFGKILSTVAALLLGGLLLL